MILYLWDQQADSIIDVKLDNADVASYIFEPMAELLAWWEKTKKDKYGKHCRNQQKHFSPFVLSVDGILGRKALFVLANLSGLMSAKMDEPISHVQGCINGRISIAVARLNS